MELGHVTVCAGNTGEQGCRTQRQPIIYQTPIITVIKQLQLRNKAAQGQNQDVSPDKQTNLLFLLSHNNHPAVHG